MLKILSRDNDISWYILWYIKEYKLDWFDKYSYIKTYHKTLK